MGDLYSEEFSQFPADGGLAATAAADDDHPVHASRCYRRGTDGPREHTSWTGEYVEVAVISCEGSPTCGLPDYVQFISRLGGDDLDDVLGCSRCPISRLLAPWSIRMTLFASVVDYVPHRQKVGRVKFSAASQPRPDGARR